MTPDFQLLLLVRMTRAFGFGVAAVLISVYLERRGLSSALIGVCLSIGLLSASLTGLGWARASRRIGRRRALALTGLLMALTGLDLAFSTTPALLLLAGSTGMLGAASIDLGPFSAIEQAMLTEAVDGRRRNLAFSRYALTGGLAAAAGGFTASLATTLQRGQAFFIAYVGLGLLAAALALSLSDRVEAPGSPAPARPVRLPRAVYALAGLFALDALGGGFVVQALVVYWLHVRFHAGLDVLGPAFAAIAVAQALSYEVAGRLANRFGLVRTMVFTHLPSNILLLLVPFAPSLAAALVLLIARFSIAQMDVPTRQAYVVSIVPPGDRAQAAALTTAVRGTAQAAGPVIAGAAIQAALFGLPFFLAGAIKIVYDLALYAGFRHRPAEHEFRQDQASSPR